MNLFPKWLQGKGEQTFYTGTVTGRGGTLPLPSIAAGSRAEALAKAKELVRRSGGNPAQLTFELKPFTGLAGLAGSTAGRFFVIIDKKTGKAVSEIYDSVQEADAELERRGGERDTRQQVMDATWHNPSREKLRKSGVLGEHEPDEDERADARPDIQDDDYVLQDRKRGGGIGFDLFIHGKYQLTHREWDEMMNAVRMLMDQDKFYPNVWYVNERGNTDLIDPTDGKIIQSWV